MERDRGEDSPTNPIETVVETYTKLISDERVSEPLTRFLNGLALNPRIEGVAMELREPIPYPDDIEEEFLRWGPSPWSLILTAYYRVPYDNIVMEIDIGLGGNLSNELHEAKAPLITGLSTIQIEQLDLQTLAESARRKYELNANIKRFDIIRFPEQYIEISQRSLQN